MRDEMKQLDELEMGNLWSEASSRVISTGWDDAIVSPSTRVRSRPRTLVAVVLALLLAVGIFTVLTSAFTKRNTPETGEGIGSSYADHGVPVTYEEITGTLHRRDNSTITQGTGRPSISQREAVALVWHPGRNVDPPGKIVTAFVDWNGVPSWVVSLQGGGVCTPYTGPVSQPPGAPVCVNFVTYRIDASSGRIVDEFSDGQLVPASQTASAPIPSLVDILEGKDPSVVQASGSPAPLYGPETQGTRMQIRHLWQHPLLNGKPMRSSADVRIAASFTVLIPPPSVGTPDVIEVSGGGGAAAWIYHQDGTTIDVVEKPTSESEAHLESSIACAADDTSCVSQGRGLTTLADGTSAVWVHYPYGTSVEWITATGVDIRVIGPYAALSLDSALDIANAIESRT